MMQTDVSQRKVWIDWMKVLGMMFIIWGHMFPYHFTDFIYSFSVPAFFWASGYLTKLQNDGPSFFRKLWRSLIVPYLIITLINVLLRIIIFQGDYLSVQSVAKSLLAIPLGIQSFPDKTAIGVGSMWFVYTLLLIKILHEFTNKNVLISLTLVSLLFVWLFKPYGHFLAVSSILLCLPFYTMGVCSKLYLNEKIFLLLKGVKPLAIMVIIMGLIIVLYLLSGMNHAPFLYKLEYGNNIWLMIFNATLGIMLLVVVSKMLETLRLNMGGVLNQGMIVILGFQRWFILLVTYIIKPRISNEWIFDIVSLALSIIILYVFIPIIKISASQFPAIVGYRKVS